MDKLEEYIRRNREDLDRYTPSADSWKKVNREIKKSKRSLLKWISIAAMVMVILGTSVIFLKYSYLLPGNTNVRSSDYNDPKLKETEIYYNSLVNSLYQEATPLLTANPEIKKELVTDISHLDSICSEIKKDLKDNIANKEVVEALIQNYRIKIQLLEDMLTILKENEKNTKKTEGYEL